MAPPSPRRPSGEGETRCAKTQLHHLYANAFFLSTHEIWPSVLISSHLQRGGSARSTGQMREDCKMRVLFRVDQCYTVGAIGIVFPTNVCETATKHLIPISTESGIGENAETFVEIFPGSHEDRLYKHEIGA